MLEQIFSLSAKDEYPRKAAVRSVGLASFPYLDFLKPLSFTGRRQQR